MYRLCRGECSTTVPSLLVYELADALRFNPKLSARDVLDAVSSVLDMRFGVLEVSSRIVNRTAEIAYAYGTTVYDACFPATARVQQATFITADERLCRKLGGAEDVMLASHRGRVRGLETSEPFTSALQAARAGFKPAPHESSWFLPRNSVWKCLEPRRGDSE